MISVVISWPDSFDFPYFRKNLSELQKYVDEVVVCFTVHGNHPLREWLTQHMPECRFLSDADAVHYPGDWRNKSTNWMIDNSKGDWLLSLEQDFFIKDYQNFFTKVKEAMQKYEAISFPEGQRWHPAFFLVKREVLEKTNRDFSVQGTDKDHFWYVTKQLKGLAQAYTDLNSIGLHYMDDWFHMAGLTENYFAPKPYYRMDDFHAYNDACAKLDLPISEYWRGEVERCSKEPRPEQQPIHIRKFL